MGVAKTKEVLKAKISGVGRTYCLQVWNEALNQTGVEASSALRRAENVYYPSAIRELGPLSSKVEVASKETDPYQGSSAKAFPSSNNPSKKVR